MAAMEYAKMARMLTRCAEIAEDANVKSIVKTTYLGILEGPASVYLNAERSVMKAESAHAKEAGEAEAALNALDQPYREARSVVKAFVPTINVPAISTKLAPVLFHARHFVTPTRPTPAIPRLMVPSSAISSKLTTIRCPVNPCDTVLLVLSRDFRMC